MNVSQDPNDYLKRWRKTPKGQAGLRAQNRRDMARRHAIKALIADHQEQYDRLFQDALRKLEREANDG